MTGSRACTRSVHSNGTTLQFFIFFHYEMPSSMFVILFLNASF